MQGCTHRRDPKATGLRADRRGVIYVEFVVAFIPLFLFFLSLIQLTMAYSAKLVVRHAANTAARAAVVVLPDDPKHYGGEPTNIIHLGMPLGSGGDNPVASFFSKFGGQLMTELPVTGSGIGSNRLAAIRSAAAFPLLAVSPSLDQLFQDASVEHTVGGDPSKRALAGALLYNRAAVAVTLVKGPGSQEFLFGTKVGPNQEVTVRVTYLFHCGVPVVRRFMCDDYISLRTGVPIDLVQELQGAMKSKSTNPAQLLSVMQRIKQAEVRMRSGGGGMMELNFAEAPSLGYLAALKGARFQVMQAEATLRNHGANYAYTGGGWGGVLNFVTNIAPMVQSIGSWTDSLASWTGSLGESGGFFSTISEGFSSISSSIDDMMSTVQSSIDSVMSSITDTISTYVDAFSDSINDLVGSFTDGMADAIGGLAEGFGDWAGQFIGDSADGWGSWLGDAFGEGAIGDWLKDNAGDWGKQISDKAGNWAKDQAEDLTKDAIKKGAKKGGDWALDKGREAIDL